MLPKVESTKVHEVYKLNFVTFGRYRYFHSWPMLNMEGDMHVMSSDCEALVLFITGQLKVLGSRRATFKSKYHRKEVVFVGR